MKTKKMWQELTFIVLYLLCILKNQSKKHIKCPNYPDIAQNFVVANAKI